ncbi:MAG: radical SAM protein [Deltaproteobacteria bacterium]|nr:radical SAM protein [Deltaproteobacteria bacterium]
MDFGPVTRDPRHLFLDIALTTRCPLHCRYCSVSRELREELTAGQWKEVVASFARLRAIEGISLEGGEPLIRRDLPELLAACLGYARSVKVVTGGVIPFQGLPDELLHHPRFLFELSLAGPEDVHDFLRDNSWGRAWGFLQAGLARGIRVRLRSVISRHNLSVYEEWLTRLDKDLSPFGRKVEFIFDTIIAPEAMAGEGGEVARVSLRNYPAKGLLPAPMEMGKLFRRLIRRDFRNLVFSQNEPLRGCGAGRMGVVSFDAAGVFSFCCEAPRGIGSIHHFAAEGCLAFLDDQTRNLPCRTCPYYHGQVCNGCWTGQKCGMVKYWKAKDCQALHRFMLQEVPFKTREVQTL